MEAECPKNLRLRHASATSTFAAFSSGTLTAAALTAGLGDDRAVAGPQPSYLDDPGSRDLSASVE
jgi:hypothetical protein